MTIDFFLINKRKVQQINYNNLVFQKKENNN